MKLRAAVLCFAVLGLTASALSEIQGWFATKVEPNDETWYASAGQINNYGWGYDSYRTEVVVSSNWVKYRIEDASVLADFFRLYQPLHELAQERQRLNTARTDAMNDSRRANQELSAAQRDKANYTRQRDRAKEETEQKRLDDAIKESDRLIATKDADHQAALKKYQDADAEYKVSSQKRQDLRDQICPEVEKVLQKALDSGLGKKVDIDGFSIYKAGQGNDSGWNSYNSYFSGDTNPDHDMLILNANGISYKIEDSKIIDSVFNLIAPVRQKEKEREATNQERQTALQTAQEARGEMLNAQRNKSALERQRAREKDETEQKRLDSDISAAQKEVDRLDAAYKDKVKLASAENKEKRAAIDKEIRKLRASIYPELDKILQDAFDRKLGKRIW